MTQNFFIKEKCECYKCIKSAFIKGYKCKAKGADITPYITNLLNEIDKEIKFNLTRKWNFKMTKAEINYLNIGLEKAKELILKDLIVEEGK